jgi:hypothetical protein
MSADCYRIASEHAINEIAEINAQIERLNGRKELLEKLLESLKLLVPETGSAALRSKASDSPDSESEAAIGATQVSRVAILIGAPEPEPGPLESPAPITRRDAEETSVHAERIGRSIAHDDVARLAYDHWNQRGQVHGHHEEDWFRAAYELQNSA